MTEKYKDLVEQYEKDGFAIIRNVLDPVLLAECRKHIEFLQKKYPTIPTEHLHHYFMRNDPFWVRLVSDPRLLDLATAFGRSFLPADGTAAVFSSHYFCKPPKTGRAVLWHQDGSYWPLKPMDVITLWLAIDDSDSENGCLRVVRGTHTIPITEAKYDDPNDTIIQSYTHREEDFDTSKIVDICLKAGDVSIHHPNIIHGSNANTSDRRRCGLTIRYIAPTTHCLSKSHPVMMMRGEAIPGINKYFSWPKYRAGHDMPFVGCETWNEKRRVEPEDEPYFDRTDWEQMDKEIYDEVTEFVGKMANKTQR